jgi:CheY-like chemotaxis protein
MSKTSILVVDDDELVRFSLGLVLEKNGFDVTCAKNVVEALQHITETRFDVLLSDLHMPDAGDGLTVVSAMRHANPNAVTLLLSGFPQMSAAANAILLQTDEILVKPMQIPALLDMIRTRLAKGPLHRQAVESVATILDRTTPATIDDWFARVQLDASVNAIPLSEALRCAHLPQLFKEVVLRLHALKPLGSKELQSPAAALHGRLRRQQGYTASMLVEESRILQVSIFNTLQNNLASIDFSILLIGVMTIADEVDHQLSQAMTAFIAESALAA